MKSQILKTLKMVALSILFIYSCSDFAKIDFLEVETLEVSNKTKTSVRLNGKLNDLNFTTVTRYGFVWSISESMPTEFLNDGFREISEQKQSGTFFIDIDNLLPNRQYYVRAFAELAGKGNLVFGESLSFMTNTIDFNTKSLVYSRGDTMTIEGHINGLDKDINISQHGHVWSYTDEYPTIDRASFSNLGQVTKDGSFFSKISDLQNHKTYYIRAYFIINLGKDIIYEPEPSLHQTDLVDVWEEKANFPEFGFSAAPSFTINNNFYIVAGGTKKLWKFDPNDGEKGTWIDLMNPYPGIGRDALTGFAIKNKGYVGLDDDGNSKRIWKYDPDAGEKGTWTKSTFEFPGESRNRASCFVLNNQAYLIAGHNFNKASNTSPSHYKLLKDVYRFDPEVGWKRMNDFAGSPRNGAMHFAIGNHGYIMGGNRTKEDVWKYDPNNDTWEQMQDFPGKGTEFGTGLNIGEKGYIGTGTSYGLTVSKVFWEYNPSNDTWTRKRDVPGEPRAWSISFTIDNKGYIGLGAISGGSTTDLWEYTPE